jgi:hypothetical protein
MIASSAPPGPHCPFVSGGVGGAFFEPLLRQEHVRQWRRSRLHTAALWTVRKPWISTTRPSHSQMRSEDRRLTAVSSGHMRVTDGTTDLVGPGGAPAWTDTPTTSRRCSTPVEGLVRRRRGPGGR